VARCSPSLKFLLQDNLSPLILILVTPPLELLDGGTSG
jgi:hypothetical protein